MSQYNEKNYAGQRYGMLVALHYTGERAVSPSGKTKRIWLLRCDCGKEIKRTVQSLCNWSRLSEDKRSNAHCGCKNKYGDESVAYEVYKMSYDDGDITFDNFVELSQQDCFHCGSNVKISGMTQKRFADKRHNGKKIKTDIINASFQYHGLDRIDNNRGHTLDNVVPCCWSCNNLRGNRNINDFLNHISRIVENYNKRNEKPNGR